MSVYYPEYGVFYAGPPVPGTVAAADGKAQSTAATDKPAATVAATDRAACTVAAADWEP